VDAPREAGDAARAEVIAAAAIALAAALAFGLLVPKLAVPISFDAVHMYLPMARRLLADGWRYLQDPDSVRVAPFAFGYVALLGAHESWVRWANLFSFSGAVVLLGAAAWRAHSPRAGVATAFLVAGSSLLRRWVPDIMTEAPFIALGATWLYAVGRIADGGRARWMALAAVAFGLASLTRPAASLFAPLAAVIFGVRALRRAGEARDVDLRIAWAHAGATLVWGAWLLHNAVCFGFPAIAGGGGNALWLGINPLPDGWDPLYFGLDYDDGALTLGVNQLSIAGDRMLAAAARLEIADTPVLQLAGLAARKAAAFVFVPPVDVYSLRGWRIVFLVFSAAALWLAPRSRPMYVAAGFAGYMLLVHLPVLFTVRYSVTAIDLPLALVAGIGVAECSRGVRRATLAFAALALAMACGWLTFQPRAPFAPRVEHAFIEPRWHVDVARISPRLERAEAVGPGVFRLSPGAALEIEVRDAPRLNREEVNVATFEMALAPSARGACTALRLRYRPRAEATFERRRSVVVPLDADGRMHRVAVGATVPLSLREEGVLRMETDCTAEATLTLGRIDVLAQNRGAVYRAKLGTDPNFTR
jgi:hypothetical protein